MTIFLVVKFYFLQMEGKKKTPSSSLHLHLCCSGKKHSSRNNAHCSAEHSHQIFFFSPTIAICQKSQLAHPPTLTWNYRGIFQRHKSKNGLKEVLQAAYIKFTRDIVVSRKEAVTATMPEASCKEKKKFKTKLFAALNFCECMHTCPSKNVVCASAVGKHWLLL